MLKVSRNNFVTNILIANSAIISTIYFNGKLQRQFKKEHIFTTIFKELKEAIYYK